MACRMEPRLDRNNEPIKWVPEQIPSTKPFMKIITSAYEPVTTFDNMRFVKTRSFVYTPFHKEARYINFEVGYSREAKWLEYLSDKWANYANFFVAGFFESIYTATEKGLPATYIQIDAKIIDYDVRFRHPSSSENYSISSPSPSSNVFAQKRSQNSTENSPSAQKSSILRKNSITIENAQKEKSDNDSNEESTAGTNQDPIMVNDNKSADSNELTRFMNYYKTFKSQESQEQQDSSSASVNQPFHLDTSKLTPTSTTQSSSSNTPTRQVKKRHLSELCNDKPDQPIDEPPVIKQKRGRGRGGRGKK